VKIVFVNSCPYLGGAELWHLRTALKLRERGHHVAMLLRPGALAQKAREEDLPVATLPMAFDLDLLSFFQALAYFRRERPDLVLLNDQRECRIIAPAAALAGIKARVQRKGWPFLKGSWRDRITYRFFITDVIANAEAVARVFREKSGMDPARIRTFPNGVDLARFGDADRMEFRERLLANPGEALIGAAGRLVSQKGFDLLVLALNMLAEEGVAFCAAIAGRGPELELLGKMARDAGVSGRVVLLGQVEDMPDFLAALDVFVFPSRMEGRSNALAEAMASCVPIVATDIPGNDELIVHEKTGLLVPAEDPRALSRAIKRIILDKELAQRLAGQARAYAERNLDSVKILDEIEAYFKELAGAQ
jgi:glycosyltransferase involved in cell wall biosynthesis